MSLLIHSFYCRRLPTSQIPYGDEAKCSDWLHQVFQEKVCKKTFRKSLDSLAWGEFTERYIYGKRLKSNRTTNACSSDLFCPSIDKNNPVSNYFESILNISTE